MGTRADKETEIEQIRLRGFDIRCEYRSFVIPPLLIAIDKRKHHFFFFARNRTFDSFSYNTWLVLNETRKGILAAQKEKLLHREEKADCK